MTMNEVIESRVRIRAHGDKEDVDRTMQIGLLQFRAPNRFRKLLRHPDPEQRRDAWGCDFDLSVVRDNVIAMQIAEFGTHPEWHPIGMGVTMDNDFALEWERVTQTLV